MSALKKHKTSAAPSSCVLIGFNEQTGQFFANPEALEFLRTIDTPISALAVAGVYRIGKSTLLNMLLNLPKGESCFKTDSSTVSCTKGIHLSFTTLKQKVEGMPLTQLLLDAEGLASNENRDLQYNVALFALINLISDILLYNHKNAIDEDSIEKWGLATEISKRIHASKEELGTQSSALAAYFPAFIFVLRDTALVPMHPKTGLHLSPKEYLEQQLAPAVGATSGVKNRVREDLKNLYPRRDCALIGIPTSDSAKLKQVDKLAEKDLSIEFRNGIYDLKQKVANFLQPKRVEGKFVDGPGFASLVELVVGIINDKNSIPNMQDLCTQFGFQQIAREATRIQKNWDSWIQSCPVFASAKEFQNPYELQCACEEKRRVLLEAFRMNCHLEFKEQVEEKARELEEGFAKHAESIIQLNTKKMALWMEGEIAALDRKSDAVETTLDSFKKEFEKALGQIVTKCGDCDPVHIMIWVENRVSHKLWGWNEKLLAKRLDALEKAGCETALLLETERKDRLFLKSSFDELMTEFNLKSAGLGKAQAESETLLAKFTNASAQLARFEKTEKEAEHLKQENGQQAIRFDSLQASYLEANLELEAVKREREEQKEEVQRLSREMDVQMETLRDDTVRALADKDQRLALLKSQLLKEKELSLSSLNALKQKGEEDSKKLEHLKHTSSETQSRLEETIRRLELQASAFRLEIQTANKSLVERAEEYGRKLNESYSKFEHSMEKYQLNQNEIRDKDMKHVKQLNDLRIEVDGAKAKLNAMEEFYSTHSDLTDAPELRRENKELVRKNSSIETMQKMKEMQLQTAEATIRDFKVKLEQEIAKKDALHASHRLELFRSLTGTKPKDEI